MNDKKFLYDYLNAYSPTAQESEGQSIWINQIIPFVDELNTDAYGTAYGLIRATRLDYERFKVVIEAHCDEIAWIITNIESDGMIRVKRHGGSDNMIAPSKTVIIHTHNGDKVRGVFGWPAIHTRKETTSKGYDQEELWIDTGLEDKEVVELAGVEIGNIVTYDTQLEQIGDYYVGRSLDNKIGGYVIAETVKRLFEQNITLPFDLYVVNSVQEEVGLYGAKLIAKKLKADLAIVTDVCHNTNTPGMNKAKDGDIKGGKGPVFEYTSQNHRKVIQQLRKVADENEIPYQLSVGSYGNDTVAFFLENTPTAILSMPLKYMHTTVEMVHIEDVEHCINLYVEFLKQLTINNIKEINNIL